MDAEIKDLLEKLDEAKKAMETELGKSNKETEARIADMTTRLEWITRESIYVRRLTHRWIMIWFIICIYNCMGYMVLDPRLKPL